MKLEPIAITGIGCRFPGADNPQAFWRLLREGVDAITEIPQSRWDADQFYDPNPQTPDKANTRWGGFLTDIDHFDPQFFGIAPREVTSMDPQHRLLLEVTWAALEDAGQIPEQLRGSATGVFIGIGTHDYSIMMWQDPVNDPYATTGTGNCIAANRLSYIFDLKGPSLAVDTACSSSLVAVHLACQSLWTGESTLALAGGVNVILLPTVTGGFAKGGFMASDGRCKSFDARADGYVRSEGAGVVVLKPLSRAQVDGDPIYAVIRGSAVNQDGSSQGMAAPNPRAQAAVLRQAYQQAGVAPGQVQYIEAHGTGTKIGDPVEFEALSEVLGQGRHEGEGGCAIASVKTNIGHAETAAGVAGLIKAALCLQHRQIPASLHFQTPNPQINFEQSPFWVPTALTTWPPTDAPIAGVNSFGFGGTNAHVVVAAAPEQKHRVENTSQPTAQLFTLSAKNAQALQALVQRYQDYLTQYPTVNLADLCGTVNQRRSHFQYRWACVASTPQQLQDGLGAFLAGERAVGSPGLAGSAAVAFLLTGQGSQFVGMGQVLYQTQPVFRAALDACDRILRPHLDRPLLEILYPGSLDLEADQQTSSEPDINQTMYTQPALFAIEYALAQVWLAWGIKPEVVVGHSIGEYVAACLAGVFSLEDGLRLIAARGRLMQALPQTGGMVAVMATEAQVHDILAAQDLPVTIAALNGPQSIVLAGEKAAIATLTANCTAAGIKATPLAVSHAFHSPLMEPMLAEFAAVAAQIDYQIPRIPVVSTVTGNRVTHEMATPDYWCRHVREPVQFQVAMQTLDQQGYALFLEIGPKPILAGMGRQCLPQPNKQWLPSLRAGQSDWQALLRSLGALYTSGVTPDWSALYPQASYQVLHLPTYAFQRQRFWWEAELPGMRFQGARTNGRGQHPLLGQRSEQGWQVQVSADQPHYLADHCLLGQVVFPATAYLEMALAAARSEWAEGAIEVAGFAIATPLILTAATPLTCEVTAAQTFAILSSVEDGEPLRHATGQYSRCETLPPVQDALETIRTRFQSAAVDVAGYYHQLEQQGLHYGPCFRGIQNLWVKDNQVLSQIQLPDTLQADPYLLHPVLLDACLQTIGAAFTDDGGQGTFLPVGCDRIQFYQPSGPELWCRVDLQPEQTTQERKANLQIFNPEGALIAELDGLTLRYVSTPSLRRLLGLDAHLNQWLYNLAWEPLPTLTPQEQPPQHWLIFADQQGIGLNIAHNLEAQGDHCTLVFAHQAPTANYHQLDPAQPQALQALWTQLTQAPIPANHILHLWSLDALLGDANLHANQALTYAHVLQILQTLPRAVFPNLNLWLITPNTQSLSATDVPRPQAATLWGLGRVIRYEYPELNCRCVDLDAQALDDGLDCLVDTLRYPDSDNQIAIRQGQRYGARLAPHALTHQDATAEAFRLGLSSYGVLDNLSLVPATRRATGAGEIEIQVGAAGVNFRDVLNALGLLTPYLEQMGFTRPEDVPFGGECAGTVVAVGSDVTDLALGDAVIAAQAVGSLAQYVTVDARFVIAKPAQLSFAEAATVPTTFLTAYYGLCHLAKLQACDRILIHAAAGGVGQAAVQIAQFLGAEIYATASPGKWDFLKGIGIKHVFNSRTLEFAEQIQTLTAGQGVDVVLNSLNGDCIDRSLDCLAPNGRFVEIGKLGIWEPAQMAARRPDVTYFPFDLLEVSREQPVLIRQLLQELGKQLQTNQLRPLPLTEFPIAAAAQAFRYMAQAKHIGKVVLTLPEPKPQGIQGDGTYLITGGLGGVGLKVAEWLVQQGAKHLVLTGRRASGPEQVIQALGATGAKIDVVVADLADRGAVEQLLSPYRATLRGIFHGAGAIADRTLQHLTWEQFTPVAAPKITGTWHLHALTQDLDLDYFVCFSSMASLLGSPGQGNYAAANAYMDALMHHRRAQGLPGLSINWGPWAEVGMAARLSASEQQRMRDQGMMLLQPDQGLDCLAALLNEPVAQAAVLPIDWATFVPQVPAAVAEPFLRLVRPAEQAQPPSALRVQLAAMGREDAIATLQTYLQAQLAKVLGYNNPDTIDLYDNFGDLGMDSLMAVELTNRLQTNLGCPISQTVLFDHPTVADLTLYLSQTLCTDRATASVPSTPDHSAQTPDPSRNPEPSQTANNLAQPTQDPPQPALPPPQPPNRDARTITPSLNIPPAHYQFTATPEYLNLRQDLDRVAELGNPFFQVHGGIANATTQINGCDLISYASYNYLGLSGDPRITAAATAAIEQYGTSVSASRVVAGERPIHQDLEQGLADFLGTEACIVYVGGHATNVTTIGHLFKQNDLILCDALSHNSIREGCQLSGATVMEFPHNDWQGLEQRLRQHRPAYEKVLIAVEGVYSTDGDLAPLSEIVALKQQFKTFLLVDEAHSIGVLGATGRGMGEHFGIAAADVDLWMGTLSKSLASCGGYIAGSHALIEYLKYTAPGFVFSVGMSPPNTAAALAALQILQAEPERVARLRARARLFLDLARVMGLNTGMSHDSPVIPVIVGEPYKAVQLSQALFESGINAQPMVYPSVPYNAARVRFFITSEHTESQIQATVAQIADHIDRII